MMPWGKEIREIVEGYAERITPEDASSLSLSFLMGVVGGHESYISKFYDTLKERTGLSGGMVGDLLEDSERGTRGTEMGIMNILKYETKDPAVRSTIELAITYAKEVETYEPE